MSDLAAPGFPEEEVRRRARLGSAAAFPAPGDYGQLLFGSRPPDRLPPGDVLDTARLVPPVLMPGRLARLIALGREPTYQDVELATDIGGLASALPLYVSALGSTRAVGEDGLGAALSRQAARLGIPLVIGENVALVHGYGRTGGAPAAASLLARLTAYAEEAAPGRGGVVVQQSTEDADAEVWNLAYSDPSALPLLESGRLAFELKLGQGAKPGLGGMTVLPAEAAGGLTDRYTVDPLFGDGRVLRSSSPGTVTEEILRQQVRLMRNNYPRARVWVKLPPGRDIALAARTASAAGADAVTVDGAEGGTGWAPHAFLGEVGLPLAECLRRLAAPPGAGPPPGLLVSGGIWEGARAAKCLALGATGVGLGRAALLATAERPQDGLVRLVECLALELRLLVSALGKYRAGEVDRDDLWSPDGAFSEASRGTPPSPADAG
ncbi:glutamate synthase-related protein [Streptomyces sp. TRM 70351]|uniref:glutamate synthase-related protein n=1 Tax=Streptomyces sp. TRM 70351 TaxID=3116552 RepID=UPI002E7C0BC5|nr:glutamate synthase-related protein [Streptomyces sp. TRM 70351]MEE1929018.1 glutamate synthase-related protein [Streptomyces sp. TRM 70351]